MQKNNTVPPGHSGKRRLSSTAISLAVAALGVLSGKMSTQAAPFINVASDKLPPFISQYVSPAQFHAIYAATGVRLTNVSHSFFDRNASPPAPNGQNTHSFGSSVSMYVSINNGATYSFAKAPAAVTVKVVHAGVNGSTSFYNTEMLQLDISGGSLPAGEIGRAHV